MNQPHPSSPHGWIVTQATSHDGDPTLIATPVEARTPEALLDALYRLPSECPMVLWTPALLPDRTYLIIEADEAAQGEAL